MKSVAGTLRDLTHFLTEERRNKDSAIQSILLSNHPAFRRFMKVTKASYRVFFTDKEEMMTWMTARGWEVTDPERWDPDSVLEWENERFNGYIKLAKDIFLTDGKLMVITEDDWDDEWLQNIDPPPEDDDIPF